jgi:hypothetical protein
MSYLNKQCSFRSYLKKLTNKNCSCKTDFLSRRLVMSGDTRNIFLVKLEYGDTKTMGKSMVTEVPEDTEMVLMV